ncbi:MAG: DUF2087 domain-containing protein [Symbiobacteriaceae bacterium]|nr:DUF2087 domain-containing protein [Symbiobacteriaceae bacterium]
MPENNQLKSYLDGLYQATPEEEERILRGAFSSRDPLRLKQIPARAKAKAVMLALLATAFEPERVYHESEVNLILRAIYEDYSALRRYLVDYRYLQRTRDGSEYRLAPSADGHG